MYYGLPFVKWHLSEHRHPSLLFPHEQREAAEHKTMQANVKRGTFRLIFLIFINKIVFFGCKSNKILAQSIIN